MMLLNKPSQSHSWWFDSRNSPRRSQWLQSTLSELDEKTGEMLKLIEEDADSFAQRAEMYYKKRPELINMVEDFYRAHRSLAERFDQLKLDGGTRLGSPFHTVCRLQRSMSPAEKSYDSYSETFDPEESGESEVDDPEPEVEGQDGNREAGEVATEDNDSEVMKLLREETERLKEENRIQKAKLMEKDEDSEVMKLLRGEIERLKEENRIQKAQLTEKDEEKREAIRQLSLALEILKEENVDLKKRLAKESSSRKRFPFELNKLKSVFIEKLFSGPSQPKTSLVAL